MADPHGLEDSNPERILVVASDAVLRGVLDQDLTDMGYEVESVASATAALRALARTSYSVAVVDAETTRPGARVVLAAGRAWQPGLQYVMTVPFAGDETTRSAMALAPFACLRMPFSSEELESVTRLAARCARACEPTESKTPPPAAATASLGPQDILCFEPRGDGQGAAARAKV